MNLLYGYAAVAWVAALFKILILAQSRAASKPAAAFNLIALALIMQNVSEGFSYYFYTTGSSWAEFSATGVIVSMVVLSAAVVHFSVTVTSLKNKEWVLVAFWSFSSMLVVAACFGYVVTGVELVGHSLKTLRTPLYPLFSIAILASILTSSAFLLAGSKSGVYLIETRSRLVMLALAPMFLTGLIVVCLGLLSIPSSSGLFMPIASTFLVMVLLKGQQDDDRIISLRLKWLQFWFHFKQAVHAANSKGPLDLQGFNERVKTSQLTQAMQYCGYNRSAVARLLDSNQTSISRAWSKIQSEKRISQKKPAGDQRALKS